VAAVGVDVKVGRHLSVQPQFRYTRWSDDTPWQRNQVDFGVGIRW
jgi:hypothetical protein